MVADHVQKILAIVALQTHYFNTRFDHLDAFCGYYKMCNILDGAAEFFVIIIFL